MPRFAWGLLLAAGAVTCSCSPDRSPVTPNPPSNPPLASATIGSQSSLTVRLLADAR